MMHKRLAQHIKRREMHLEISEMFLVNNILSRCDPNEKEETAAKIKCSSYCYDLVTDWYKK